MANVQVEGYALMKVVGANMLTSKKSNVIYKTKSFSLQKQTNEQAKQQRKKSKFTTSDDNTKSTKAYSSIIEVDDVHNDLPPSDLQDLMVQYSQ